MSECSMYLNDGKGYACAGQANAKDSPPLLSKVPIDLDFEENLGAAPPMGSTTKKFHFLILLLQQKLIVYLYLYVLLCSTIRISRDLQDKTLMLFVNEIHL